MDFSACIQTTADWNFWDKNACTDGTGLFFFKLFSSNTVYPSFHSTYSVLYTTNLNDFKYVNTHRCYDQGNRWANCRSSPLPHLLQTHSSGLIPSSTADSHLPHAAPTSRRWRISPWSHNFIPLTHYFAPALNISTHSLRTHRSLLPGSMLTVANLLLWALLTLCFYFQGTNQISVEYSAFLTPLDPLCHQAHPNPQVSACKSQMYILHATLSGQNHQNSRQISYKSTHSHNTLLSTRQGSRSQGESHITKTIPVISS